MASPHADSPMPRRYRVVRPARGPRTVRPGGEREKRLMREQRRSKVIAMSTEELDAYLTAERTCRLATVGPSGPHVSPVWFIWSGGDLWIYSLIRSQRWTDVQRDP